MNDQMYKQNKRVMNAEYNQEVPKEKLNIRANHRNSRREQLSFSEASVTSERLNEEPFLKSLTRGFLQFIFSQVDVTFNNEVEIY